MSALSSISDKIRAADPKILDAVISFLELVQAATGIGGTTTHAGLEAVGAGLRALDSHAAGAITHDQLIAQIAHAHAQTAADRADQDAAP